MPEQWDGGVPEQWDGGLPEPDPVGSPPESTQSPQTERKAEASIPRTSASVIANAPEHTATGTTDNYRAVITDNASVGGDNKSTGGNEVDSTDGSSPETTVIEFDDKEGLEIVVRTRVQVTSVPDLSYADVTYGPRDEKAQSPSASTKSPTASKQSDRRAKDNARRRRAAVLKKQPPKSSSAPELDQMWIGWPKPQNPDAALSSDEQEKGADRDPGKFAFGLDPLANLTEEVRSLYRRLGKLKPFRAIGSRGYAYRRDEIIGPAFEGTNEPFGSSSATLLMRALKSYPNAFFPFRVIPVDGGNDSIRLDGLYSLEARIGNASGLLPPGINPVEVVKVTPTSFTFETKPGHFDGTGSLVTFRTYVEDGVLHLEHEAATRITEDQSPLFIPYALGAEVAWSQQAENLRTWYNSFVKSGQ